MTKVQKTTICNKSIQKHKFQTCRSGPSLFLRWRHASNIQHTTMGVFRTENFIDQKRQSIAVIQNVAKLCEESHEDYRDSILSIFFWVDHRFRSARAYHTELSA